MGAPMGLRCADASWMPRWVLGAPMRLSVDVVEGSCFLLFSLCFGVEGDQSHTGLDDLRLRVVVDRRWLVLSPITNQGSQPFPDHQSGKSAAPRSANPQVLVWAVRIQGMSFYFLCVKCVCWAVGGELN